MSQQMQIIKHIWLQVPRMALNVLGKKKIMLYVFGSILLVAAAVFSILITKENFAWYLTAAIAFGAGVGVTVFLMGLSWYAFLSSLVARQYLPSHAQLIVQFKRHLQIALLVPLIVFPLIALVIQSLIEEKLSLEGWLYFSLFLSGPILTVRNSWGFPVFMLALQLPNIFFNTEVWKNLEQQFTTKIILIPCVWILIVFGLHWVFNMNEQQRFAVEKRSISFKGWMSNEMKNTHVFSGFFYSPYIAWMKWNVEHFLKRPSEANKIRLQIFGLSPSVHWLTTLFSMLTMTVVLLIFIFLMEIIGIGKKMSVDFYLGLLIAQIPMISFLYVTTLLTALYSCRKEQSLLQLVPMAGGRERQNRVLLTYFLQHFFAMWLLSAVALLALFKLFDFSDQRIHMLVLAHVSTLFFSLALVSNQTKRITAYDHKVMPLLFLVLVIFGLCVTILMLTQASMVWVLVVGILLLYGVSLKVLWAKRMQEQSIFPVGYAA